MIYRLRVILDNDTKEDILRDVEIDKNSNLTEYHRTFSILVISVNTALFLINKKLQLGNKHINYVMMLLVLEIFTGASMFYFDFPFGTQTAHLVFASIIFGLQFYILLQNFLTENKLKVDDLQT